jgi:protein deglycase
MAVCPRSALTATAKGVSEVTMIRQFALAMAMVLVAMTSFAAQPKKVVVVLAEGFDEIEAAAPIDVMRRAGLSVTVAGLDGANERGTNGLVFTTDVSFHDVNIADYDAIVLPGGLPGADNLAKSDVVISAVREAAKNGKVVAAICASPALVLVRSGVLDGRRATCYPGMESNFSDKTRYVKAETVTDGNLITANGPGSSMLFGIAIVDKMVGHETALDLESGLLIGK